MADNDRRLNDLMYNAHARGQFDHPATTPEPSESAALAEVIHAARTEWIKQPPWLGVDDGYADYLARAVLASAWLADHDKRVRDEALAEVCFDCRNAARTGAPDA